MNLRRLALQIVLDRLTEFWVIGDVAVAVDGVLDDAAGHGEIHHIHELVTVHLCVDQAAGESVPAAEGELHRVALDKTLVVVGLEPEHQLTEGNDSEHLDFLLSFYCTGRNGLIFNSAGNGRLPPANIAPAGGDNCKYFPDRACL